MYATEQTNLGGTDIIIDQMKPPDNSFGRQRLNPQGDESWNEMAINSLMRLHAPLGRRCSSQLSLSLQARYSRLKSLARTASKHASKICMPSSRSHRHRKSSGPRSPR